MSTPPPESRTSAGKPILVALCGLIGAAVGVGVVVVLGMWGGVVGRVLVSAGGFAAAGLLLPWLVVAIVYGNKDPGCVHSLVSISGGTAGFGIGIWFGLTNDDLPWWTFAGSGVVAAMVGGAAGAVACVRAVESKKRG